MSRALSKDEIFKETEDMSEIINDFVNNGVTNPQDSNFRWNGPSMSLPSHHELATADIQRRQAIQQAHEGRQRAELAAAEKAKGSPLTPAERLFVFRAVK
jgi:hypothetical protein